MSEVKTIEQLLIEKQELEKDISSMVNFFLRDNPNITDIEFVKSIFSYDYSCGTLREISVYIKLVM